MVEHIGAGRDKCVGIITLDDLLTSKMVDATTASEILLPQMSDDLALDRSSDEKHNDRLEQTLNRFQKIMSETLSLHRDLAESVSFFALKQIVRRLGPTEAAHFISQLPRLLQEDLLDLPAGPDRNITAESMIRDVAQRFDLNKEAAKETLRNFGLALRELTGDGEFDHVCNQLPSDLRELFTVFREPPPETFQKLEEART